MEKIEVCFIRLYTDNPEDALIIAGLGTRKRKGDKSRVIKDILYAYFTAEQTALPPSKSIKISLPPDYSTTPPQSSTLEPSSQLKTESP